MTLLAGRFELLRPLGAGGLAEVHAARDAHTGEEVALKLLHAHLAREPSVADRFRRELQVIRGLSHPAVVRGYDLHEHEGRPLFAMELLRGEALSQRLARGPLPAAEARRLAGEVARALGAAHAAGIVHRDLKPQNVFLCTDGAVKLLDFGLARVASAARLTTASMVLGTPGYIAPELLSGATADARADLYSLGATLFEMLTGKLAFPGSDPYEVLQLQKQPLPADPLLTTADRALLERALQVDPEQRFLDASQFVRALQGESIPKAFQPSPPSAPKKPPLWRRLFARSHHRPSSNTNANLDTNTNLDANTALLRLTQGIDSRLSLLRARIANAPPPKALLLEGTLSAAESAAATARELSASAALLGGEGEDLSPDRTRAREAAVARLLQIAAALDEALAAASR